MRDELVSALLSPFANVDKNYRDQYAKLKGEAFKEMKNEPNILFLFALLIECQNHIDETYPIQKSTNYQLYGSQEKYRCLPRERVRCLFFLSLEQFPQKTILIQFELKMFFFRAFKREMFHLIVNNNGLLHDL